MTNARIPHMNIKCAYFERSQDRKCCMLARVGAAPGRKISHTPNCLDSTGISQGMVVALQDVAIASLVAVSLTGQNESKVVGRKGKNVTIKHN